MTKPDNILYMKIASLILACCSCALALGLLIAMFMCRNATGSRSCSISQYAIVVCIMIATVLNIIFSALSPSARILALSAPIQHTAVSTPAAAVLTPSVNQAAPGVARPLSQHLQILYDEERWHEKLPAGVLATLDIPLVGSVQSASLSMLKYVGFRIASVNSYWSASHYGYASVQASNADDVGKLLAIPYIPGKGVFDFDTLIKTTPAEPIVWVGYDFSRYDDVPYVAHYYRSQQSIQSITLARDDNCTAFLIHPLPLQQYMPEQ